MWPQDACGLEKLASREPCKHYTKDFGIECRIGRFHNIYGPFGTWKGDFKDWVRVCELLNNVRVLAIYHSDPSTSSVISVFDDEDKSNNKFAAEEKDEKKKKAKEPVRHSFIASIAPSVNARTSRREKVISMFDDEDKSNNKFAAEEKDEKKKNAKEPVRPVHRFHHAIGQCSVLLE
ncbi:hypothetical protein Droror1_Dr00017830, partial [Drosera rotundifolia]